jgi:hypothetical protein
MSTQPKKRVLVLANRTAAMQPVRTRSRALLPSLVVCLTFAVALAAPAVVSAAGNVQAKPIGNPTWKPTDLNLFTAPIGTAASGYAEFGETQVAILPEPNHRFHPALGIGPGDPHARPYNNEISRGLRSLGLPSGGHFTVEDFSDGNGIWLAYMVVPRRPGSAPRGSSPDFDFGPIIPNSLFPIDVTGFAERFGEPFSVLAEFSVPPLDASLDPPFDVDGHSHFPIFIADSIDFGPAGVDPDGRYEWTIRMLDQTGNGWEITVRFVIGDS